MIIQDKLIQNLRLVHKKKNRVSNYMQKEYEDYKEEINEIREYQKEIFENCKDKNSIIFLETGTGKSLISILLIDYYLKKHKKEKKIAFLSNEVNLVEQQTTKILRLLPEIQKFLQESEGESNSQEISEIVIETLHGDMGIDYWNNTKWKRMVINTDVFSCTTQVFLNCLRKGYLKLYEFCLIIFDECHHTEKNHAFNNIMREFYYFYNQQNLIHNENLYQLPYIIGMTASPAKFSKSTVTTDQLKEKLKSLCTNLNSNFVWFNQTLVETYLKKPNILIIPFNEEEIQTNFRFLSKWFENIENIDTLKDFHSIILPNSKFNFLSVLNETYEAKFMNKNFYNQKSNFCQSLLDQIHKLISNRALYLLIELGGFAFWNYIADINKKMILEINTNILKTEEKQLLMTDLTIFFQDFLNSQRNLENHISSKCLSLVNVLIDRFDNTNINEEITAIIFVSKRLLAKYLKILLQKYFESNNMSQLKIDFIIGHHNIYYKQRVSNDEFIKRIEDFSEINSCENDIINEVFTKRLFYQEINKKEHKFPNLIDIKFKLPEQIKTLRSFRNKQINILISTSVTEEGLDVPDCNLVISFSEPKTIKSFIQLKGRARKEKSEYLILSPESKRNEISIKIENYEQMFCMMKEISSQMASSDQTQNNLNLGIPLENYYYIMIKDTDACINTNWSIDLVSYYCSFLRNDNIIRSKPVYYLIDLANVGYIYCLILPPSSKIQIIRGDLCKKKSDAKKLVAFICCKLLFEHGCLNSDLKPSSFNHYGLDSKNDEEEIREEDEEYRSKLDKILITHKKLKRNNEEICNNYYPNFNENQICGTFNPFFIISEKYLEFYIYEICFSNDFYIFLPRLADKKLALLHKDPNLHEIYFKICPELSQLPEKTVQLICKRKIFLKEHEYYDLLIQHFFIGLGLNNNDVRFYEMMTGEKIKNSFVFNFKGKHNFSYNMSGSINKQLTIFTFLKFDNSIDFDTMNKIKSYVELMSKFFKIINENLIARKERLKIDLNQEFVKLLRENKPFDDLVLQSVTNLQKYVIFDMKKIKYIDLRKLKIGKYNMLERKSFLEKKFNFYLSDNDYVIYCTSLYRDYMKNLRSYIFKEKERSLTYALPIEVTIFPLGLKTLLWCQYLPFVWQQLQNFLTFNLFKTNFLIPKEYSCFLKGENQNPSIYNIPISANLLLYESLMKYFQQNKINFLDLEKTKEITNKVFLLKNKTFSETIKNKRSRKIDETMINEYKGNPSKKIHQDTNNNYFGSINEIGLTLKENFMTMKIICKNIDFESSSVDINAKDLQSALTFRTYDFNDSYERLEFFGDSILKLLSSIEVFFEYPLEAEGFLSKKRSKIVSNSFLKKACIKNEIYQFILMNPKVWIPNGLIIENNKPEDTQENFNSEEILIKKGYSAIPNKTLADVIESLTAVYYKKNKKIEASQTFLNLVGVLKYPKLNYLSNLSKNDTILLETVKSSGNLLIEKFSFLEKIIDYKFNNINLLIQAFTHISFRETINNVLYLQFNEKNLFTQHENLFQQTVPSVENDYYLDVNMNDMETFNERIDKNSNIINRLNPSEFCYDRMEFLGDSIFDFLVVNHLYHKMIDEDPNGLSLMKAAIVNNHVLSLITLYYKLHHFILFENKILKDKIDILEEKIDGFIENISIYFSENEACVKILADVFESLIGAIFIDCGLDIKKTEEVVMKMAGKFVVKFADKDLANTSPLNELKKYCEELKLGVPKIKQICESNENQIVKFKYILTIKEKKIAEVVASNKKEAEEKLKKIAMKEIPRIFHDIN